MKAKEWLGVMQKANDFNELMTKLIEEYGKMLLEEYIKENGMNSNITICDICRTKLIK